MVLLDSGAIMASPLRGFLFPHSLNLTKSTVLFAKSEKHFDLINIPNDITADVPHILSGIYKTHIN